MEAQPTKRHQEELLQVLYTSTSLAEYIYIYIYMHIFTQLCVIDNMKRNHIQYVSLSIYMYIYIYIYPSLVAHYENPKMRLLHIHIYNLNMCCLSSLTPYALRHIWGAWELGVGRGSGMYLFVYKSLPLKATGNMMYICIYIICTNKYDTHKCATHTYHTYHIYIYMQR